MGFFKNNLLKSLEWVDDSTDTIVYKYPMDGRQIQYGSKLTVRASQVAVFLNKGKIADIFQPGMYTLQTSNLPILSSQLAVLKHFLRVRHKRSFPVQKLHIRELA